MHAPLSLSNFLSFLPSISVFNGMPAYERWEWKSNGSRWEPVPIMICLQIQASRDLRREASTRAHVLGLGEARKTSILAGLLAGLLQYYLIFWYAVSLILSRKTSRQDRAERDTRHCWRDC